MSGLGNKFAEELNTCLRHMLLVVVLVVVDVVFRVALVKFSIVFKIKNKI